MASSDRFDPTRDRYPGIEGSAGGTLDKSEKPRAQSGAIEPPQYFDPVEPWDAQSAEALTRLYESGEARLDRHPVEKGPRSWQPPQGALPSPPPAVDTAWLEARLADIAQRLQGSLAELNPDKSLAPLNRRLDLIEQRFAEALSQVAQRSDLDGLRLIEANVMELAAHIEQTRGRLDRLDAIDDQVRGLAQRLEEGDHQRLAALEKLLLDYMAERRRGDERTASVLGALEDTVNRIGDSVEAMEAHKPVPDLSLSMLGTPAPGNAPAQRDPLSQVYADTSRALEEQSYRSPLDAADYAPKPELPAENRMPPAPIPAAQPAAPQDDARFAPDALPPPVFRASAMRAKLRQAQVLGAEAAIDAGRSPVPQAKGEPADTRATRRARPGFLLAAGVTLFAAGGYLLVDLFMSATTSPPTGMERGARPSDAKASRAASEGPAGGDNKAPDAELRAGDRKDMTPPSPPQEGQPKAPGIEDQTGQADPPASTKIARMEAIGGAMAAVFRAKAPAGPPLIASTASIGKGPPPAFDEETRPPIVTLPMTIGPASLRQAAMRGDAAAQFEVATRFAAGLGVSQDLQQAFQWYSRSAAQGMALAQYRLAALHERGLGTRADPERARIWYARAAEQGNVKAMHNLGVLSASGGRSDYAKAAKWFAQAADYGLADSQFNLAVLHQNGLGVAKDLKQAYKWLTLAARGGDREATSRAAEVKARLDPIAVREVDPTLASWSARTPEATANEPAAATVTMAP